MSTTSSQVKRVRTRTRTGCWTCRARRKKCDECHPHCKTCTDLALNCEGYEVRLKWGVHRKPVTVQRKSRKRGQCAPPSRKRDTALHDGAISNMEQCKLQAKNDMLLKYLDRQIFDSLREYERELLHEFIEWGASTLSSSFEPGAESCAELLSGCTYSKSFLVNCLTYQITLDSKHAAHAERYYGRSIDVFRNELSSDGSVDNEATIYAGILLCSISMNRAMPWTVHLNGIASILNEKGAFQNPDRDMEDVMFLIAALDLPVYILGRKTHNLHMWYYQCRFQSGIEDFTGLPYSLVDLLSSVMESDIEQRLLQWPGERGDPSQCKIWDATRYAGIISARDYRTNQGLDQELYSSGGVNQTLDSINHPLLFIAVRNIMSILHDLRAESGDGCSPIWQLPLYPLVAAGSQHWALSVSDREFIIECLLELACGSFDTEPYYESIATVLQELWVDEKGRTIQQVAKCLGLELGLFQ